MTKTCSQYTRKTLGKKSWKCYNLTNKETQSLLLTFNRLTSCLKVSVVDFSNEFVSWVMFLNDSKGSNGYSIPSPENKYMLSNENFRNNRR